MNLSAFVVIESALLWQLRSGIVTLSGGLELWHLVCVSVCVVGGELFQLPPSVIVFPWGSVQGREVT